MTNAQPIKTILIHSSGTSNTIVDLLAGWQIALMLAHKCQRSELKLIHLCARPKHQGLQAIRLDQAQLMWLQQLGVSEKQLLTECEGNHTLGSVYQGFSSETQEFTYIEGSYGVDFDRVGFHHYLSRLHSDGLDGGNIDEYSLAAVMAKQQLFVHPIGDERSILSTFSYALNVNVELFCTLLAAVAKKLGIIEQLGSLDKVNLDMSTGFIRSIELKAGANSDLPTVIPADFFIDCSQHGSPLGKHLTECDFQSWSGDLPANKTSSCVLLKGHRRQSVDQLQGFDFGWSKTTHLKNHSVLECCYNDNYSAAQVFDVLQKQGVKVERSGRTSHPEQSLQQGVVSRSWQKNWLLLGAASATIEPLVSNTMSLIHRDLNRWLCLFPDKDCRPELANYYNQQTLAQYHSLKDFHMCHYLMSQWRQTDFWQRQGQAQLSSQLTHSLALFTQSGVFPQYEQAFIDEHQICAFLLGFQYWPSHVDPLSTVYSSNELLFKLSNLRKKIRDIAEKIPDYTEYLSQHGV